MRPSPVMLNAARRPVIFALGVLAFGAWPSVASAQERFSRNLGIYYQFVPHGQTYGARLTRNPYPKSPAAELGLETNDMIVGLDGHGIGRPEDFDTHVARTDVTFIDGRTNQTTTRSVFVPHWAALDRLSRSAEGDIRRGIMPYEKPHMEAEGDTLKWNFDFVVDRSYFKDWSEEDFDPQVPFENRPVMAELIVQALRATQVGERAFWEPYLNRVDKVIAEGLAHLTVEPKGDTATFDELDRRIQEIYSEAMQSYAASRGLRAEYEPRFRMRGAFDVIISNPDGHRIGLLPLTRYEVALALNPGVKAQDLGWRPYNSGSRVKLLGSYMYVLFTGPRTPPATVPARFSVENEDPQVLR